MCWSVLSPFTHQLSPPLLLLPLLLRPLSSLLLLPLPLPFSLLLLPLPLPFSLLLLLLPLLCPGSIDPNDKSLRGRAAVLQHGLSVLQRDLQRLRVEQRNQLQLFQHDLRQSCSILLGKLRLHQELGGGAHLVPEEAGFRRKRLELVPEEDAYLELSGQLYKEFQ